MFNSIISFHPSTVVVDKYLLPKTDDEHCIEREEIFITEEKVRREIKEDIYCGTTQTGRTSRGLLGFIHTQNFTIEKVVIPWFNTFPVTHL